MTKSERVWLAFFGGDDVQLFVQAEPGFQYEHWGGKMGWEAARSRAVAEDSVLYGVDGNTCSRGDWQFEKPVAMGLPVLETHWLRWCLGLRHFARNVSI